MAATGMVAFASTIGAQATSPPVITENSELASIALATQVILVTYPREKALEQSIRGFEKNFRDSFANNPENAALVERYPGLLEALIGAGRSEMRDIIEKAVEPAVLSQLARQLATQLSYDDLSELLEFYTSPAGQALASLDPATLDPQTELVPVQSLKLQHRIAIGEFQQSSAGKRSGPLIMSLFAQMGQMGREFSQPHLPRLQSAIRETARSYISTHSGKKD